MTDTNDTLLEFPCEFPIKMMGRDHPPFHAAARELVEAQAGPVSDDAIRHATSRNGRFLAITITITATSQAQLDDIYQSLSDHEEILVAL